MNAYEISFVTFENLYRRYYLYSKNEQEAIQETKKVYPRLSEVLFVKKIEVK